MPENVSYSNTTVGWHSIGRCFEISVVRVDEGRNSGLGTTRKKQSKTNREFPHSNSPQTEASYREMSNIHLIGSEWLDIVRTTIWEAVVKCVLISPNILSFSCWNMTRFEVLQDYNSTKVFKQNTSFVLSILPIPHRNPVYQWRRVRL